MSSSPRPPTKNTDQFQPEFSSVQLADGTIKEYKVTSTQPFLTWVDPIAAGLFVLALLYQVFINWTIKPSLPFLITSLPLLLCVLSKLNRVKEESLLVIHEFGVQLKKKYFTGKEKNLFLDRSRIKDVIINEGFFRCRIIFYLAFIEEGRPNLVLAFEDLIPRLNTLLRVYKGTRAVLYGEKELVSNGSE
eukprot:TRINITY_DN3913_c0_g4_i1.p1 TRINITY_DN3913_c0_g4~~TRINITY_DN3913_c0_g4_i1.p1  ORF type:complete len:190 (-),score=28.01 TRINITY_DN3913_c0_g4_i1:4-573(-)